jgi:hypothetical protein
MKNSDKPAYPDNWDAKLPGLTKREYFAAMAMQGLLSNDCMIDQTDSSSIEWAAKSSVSVADALLKELEK